MLVRLLGANPGLPYESPMLNCLSHWSAVTTGALTTAKFSHVSDKNRTQELHNAGSGFDLNLDLKIFSGVPLPE